MNCSKKPYEATDKNFWDERWKTNDTGWDMKHVSPPLQHYIDTIMNKDISVLIPGCGNAYEAAYLLESGFTNVTVIDISPVLVNDLLKKFDSYAGKELTIICGDFFKLNGKFDLILEQTFFCALTPNLRDAYSEKMFELLSADGKLAGLLFNRTFESSPPFGGNRDEYIQLFSQKFTINQMEQCDTSIDARKGFELFFELKRKPQA